MDLAQLLMVAGLLLVGAGGVLHYPAIPYLKAQFRGGSDDAAHWARGAGLVLLVLSLFA